MIKKIFNHLFENKIKYNNIYKEFVKYSHDTALENPDMIYREYKRLEKEFKKDMDSKEKHYQEIKNNISICAKFIYPEYKEKFDPSINRDLDMVYEIRNFKLDYGMQKYSIIYINPYELKRQLDKILDSQSDYNMAVKHAEDNYKKAQNKYEKLFNEKTQFYNKYLKSIKRD
jgi:hypothetical protein